MFQKIRNLFNSETQATKGAEVKSIAGVGSNSVLVDIPFLALAAFEGDRISPVEASILYRRSSAVATAIDMIAGEFSRITPVIYDRVEKVFLDDHEVLDLLHAPNSIHTYSQFIEELGHYFLLNGTAYVGYIGLVDFPAEQIWPVDNQEVSASTLSEDRYPNFYYLSQSPSRGTFRREGIEKWRFIEDARMKELTAVNKFASRTTKTFGDSPLEAALLEARQQISSRLHNLQLIDNGGRPSLAFILKNTQQIEDDDQMQRTKTAIREEFAGGRNAGKISVIAADDMELQELGNALKDMDFAQLDQVSSRAIYMRYKIPLALVTTDAATFNNYETALMAFYEQAVLPNLKLMLNGLGEPLLLRTGMDTKRYSLTFDPDTVKPLMARRLAELKTRKELGLETINELRAEIPGREPVEGGDEIYQLSSLVPLGSGPINDPLAFDPTEPIEGDPLPADPDDDDDAGVEAAQESADGENDDEGTEG